MDKKIKHSTHHTPVFLHYYALLYDKLTSNENLQCVARFSKELDVTYSHISKIVKEGKEKGNLKLTKVGRVVYAELTKQGLEVGKAAKTIIINSK